MMINKVSKWLGLIFCVLGLLYGYAMPVAAADIIVSAGGCGLIDAIKAANLDQAVGPCPAGSGPDKILLQDDVEISASNNTDFGGGNALPTITSEIIIEGQGHKIARRTIGPVFYRIVSVAANGALTIRYTTLANGRFQDQPSAYGAGIYNRGRLSIMFSTLKGHENYVAVGGAIYNEGVVWLQASTISNNWSRVNGDAIYNKGGIVNIVASTLSNNSNISSGGSDLYNEGGSVKVNSSILANSAKAKCGGLITSLGNNLVADASCNFANPGDRNNTDPLLSPLRDNGGSTWTHSPLVGSPALDAIPASAGCALLLGTDQRGAQRPQGSGCDIGALEVLVGADITPPTISAAIVNPNATGWYNRDVEVHFTCADNVGGLGLAANGCPTNRNIWYEKAGVVVVATVKDLAGNLSQPSNEVIVNVDKTAPTIWAVATTNANADGWYNRDVIIHFICADTLSGVVSCPADQVLRSEGAAVSSTPQTVSDRAGNTAISNIVTVKIDKRLVNPPPPPPSWQTQLLLSRPSSLNALPGALALDRDGNPIILLYDTAAKQPWLVHCGTLVCRINNRGGLVDDATDTGRYSAMVLDSSGNPVVSYYDATNGDLKVRHCFDDACTSGSVPVAVDSVGVVGWYPSIQLDSSGNPVISYLDGSNGDLKVAHCGSTDCASGNTIQTVDSDGVAGLTLKPGFNTSLVLDRVGNPVVSYYEPTNQDLKVVHCGNPTCTSGNIIQIVDGTGDVGGYAALKLDRDGNPVVSYYDNTNGDLKLVRCGNPTCTNGNTVQIVASAGNVGKYIALVLDNSGNPVISYTNTDLNLVRCNNPTCTSSNTVQIVANPVFVSSQSTALTLDSGGNPVILYQRNDLSTDELRLTRLLADVTPPIITPDVVAPLGNAGPVTVNWNVVEGETSVTSRSGCTSTTVKAGTGVVTLTCLATSIGGTSSHTVVAGSAPGSQTASDILAAADVATAVGTDASVTTTTLAIEAMGVITDPAALLLAAPGLIPIAPVHIPSSGVVSTIALPLILTAPDPATATLIAAPALTVTLPVSDSLTSARATPVIAAAPALTVTQPLTVVPALAIGEASAPTITLPLSETPAATAAAAVVTTGTALTVPQLVTVPLAVDAALPTVVEDAAITTTQPVTIATHATLTQASQTFFLPIIMQNASNLAGFALGSNRGRILLLLLVILGVGGVMLRRSHKRS